MLNFLNNRVIKKQAHMSAESLGGESAYFCACFRFNFFSKERRPLEIFAVRRCFNALRKLDGSLAMAIKHIAHMYRCAATGVC